MATSRNSVDPIALRSSADQVRNIASNLQSELSSLEGIVRSTADAWEGAAKDSVEEVFQAKYKKYLNDIIASLGNYSSAMTAFANDNDEVAAQGARRFSGL